jgi:hypothetical protein
MNASVTNAQPRRLTAGIRRARARGHEPGASYPLSLPRSRQREPAAPGVHGPVAAGGGSSTGLTVADGYLSGYLYR